MKKGFLSVSAALLAPCGLGVVSAVTIYEDPSATNSLLFRDFTSAPGSVTFNNGQLQGVSGGGTTTYETNGNGSDPQVTFGGGSLDQITFPNFRARYRITNPSGAVNVWRNPAVGGQAISLPNGGGSFVEGTGTIPNPLNPGTGYRLDPVGSGNTWTLEMDYIRLDRAPTIGWEFDNAGDSGGLTINAANYASAVFGNGSFVGQANAGGGVSSDVSINFPAASWPDPDIYKWLEVRIKVDAGDRVDFFFSNTATGGVETRSLTTSTDGSFHTYLVDLSDEAAWSGTLDFLRLDPSANSSANFEVDYIRFMESALVPEPSVPLLGGLAGLLLLRRRRR